MVQRIMSTRIECSSTSSNMINNLITFDAIDFDVSGTTAKHIYSIFRTLLKCNWVPISAYYTG